MQQYDGPVRDVPAYDFLYVQDTTAIVGVTPQQVKRVYLRLWDGTETHLDIPVGDYTPATFQREVTKLVQNHLAIRNIAPPTIQVPSE